MKYMIMFNPNAYETHFSKLLHNKEELMREISSLINDDIYDFRIITAENDGIEMPDDWCIDDIDDIDIDISL